MFNPAEALGFLQQPRRAAWAPAALGRHPSTDRASPGFSLRRHTWARHRRRAIANEATGEASVRSVPPRPTIPVNEASDVLLRMVSSWCWPPRALDRTPWDPGYTGARYPGVARYVPLTDYHGRPVDGLADDPALGNTCLLDPAGGSVSFYDTRVRLIPVES